MPNQPLSRGLRQGLLAAALGIAVLAASTLDAAAQRYATPPPVQLSPDLQSAWTLQLRKPRVLKSRSSRSFRRALARRKGVRDRSVRRSARRNARRRHRNLRRIDTHSRVASRPVHRSGVVRARPVFDPSLLPRVVRYETRHKPGTIVVDTVQRRLFLVMSDGRARRYGIGVGKPGFEWAGSHKVTRKREWPGWTPPKEMIAREAAKGRILPNHMPGGPDNPLGARALYLGSTLYRIHGTNQAWSIGQAVSSGCIRMRNEDVMDLYDRIKVGTRVHVI